MIAMGTFLLETPHALITVQRGLTMPTKRRLDEHEKRIAALEQELRKSATEEPETKKYKM